MRGVSLRAEGIASAAIAHVELRAMLAAATHRGRMTGPTRDSALLEMERPWDGIAVIAVDGRLLREAGDLAEQMRLRAYDAVHLAALRQMRHSQDLVFACWGSDLRGAAGLPP